MPVLYPLCVREGFCNAQSSAATIAATAQCPAVTPVFAVPVARRPSSNLIQLNAPGAGSKENNKN
jgi:hypothetical protein